MRFLNCNRRNSLPCAIAGLFVVSLGATLLAAGQAADEAKAYTHNIWSSGAPMPVATSPAVAVLENRIFAVGGTDTQVYDLFTDTWSTGAPLPVATGGGCAAVAKNVLYYIGGANGTGWTSAVWVWGYDAKTKSWSWSAGNPIPTGGANGGCAVANNIIYVFGGYNGGFLTSVESYNPATDTWAEEAPMLNPEAGLPGGRAHREYDRGD